MPYIDVGYVHAPFIVVALVMNGNVVAAKVIMDQNHWSHNKYFYCFTM